MAPAAPHLGKLTSVKVLTDVPVEIIQEVIKHVDESDLLALRSVTRYLHAETQTFFRKTFFTERCHKATVQSLKVLVDITRHEVFCKDLKTVTLKAVLDDNLGSGREGKILSAFKNLYACGTRLNLGVGLIYNGKKTISYESLARFHAKILRLSASIQSAVNIVIVVDIWNHIEYIWNDHMDGAIPAQLATGSSLEFRWPNTGAETSACYTSEDNSLTFKYFGWTSNHESVMCGRIRECINDGTIKSLEILRVYRCDMNYDDLVEWLETFPEIKTLSLLEMEVWPSRDVNGYPKADCECHQVLREILKLRNLEVLVVKDNKWMPNVGEIIDADAPYLNGMWKLDDIKTDFYLTGKQNIQERLQEEISELRGPMLHIVGTASLASVSAGVFV